MLEVQGIQLSLGNNTNALLDTVFSKPNYFSDGIGNAFSYVFTGKVQKLEDIGHEFVEPADSTPAFKPYYDQYILPHVKDFEQKRIEALEIFRKRAQKGLPIASIIITTGLGLFFTMDFGLFFIFITLALLSVLGWCVFQPIVSYKSSVKDIIFPIIFKFFGDNFEYSKTGVMTVSSLEKSDIIPSHDTAQVEDYVKGSYKNVEIELTEACLKETRGSGKNQRVVTVFHGIFIRLGMNKNFHGKTIVKRDNGKVGNWLLKKVSSLETVHLEDPEFENVFQVYSNDQIEARYLLTSSFMERLRSLTQLFGGNIQASFYDDKLLMMLPSDVNRFETSSVFVPSTFIDDIATIRSEMTALFNIIDVLKLDQHTGL